jgi:predicted ester cyclase
MYDYTVADTPGGNYEFIIFEAEPDRVVDTKQFDFYKEGEAWAEWRIEELMEMDDAFAI